ncbi:hypothetical protein OIE66_30255 [Nonomuraea sp. NBC_01738]|uniref:hypothetical protein n=1 Tax=Nonomuraea sp. NBC_01738 TaxID=2976003 RepID=UPI002E13CC21|nr:hypothetical protein OIE66_30255 [Nonomuraea sp. NBC_01738]
MTAAPSGRVRGSTLPVAPFRASPGDPAGSFGWKLGQGELEVKVLPAYRDGAYLVASFDVVSRLPEGRMFVPVPAPLGGWSHEFSARSDYGALTLVDPATKARYYPVKTRSDYVENQVPVIQPGQSSRSYVYFPAPPDDRTSITLEVAGGGTHEVPISR